jgi:hypothetical protein
LAANDYFQPRHSLVDSSRSECPRLTAYATLPMAGEQFTQRQTRTVVIDRRNRLSVAWLSHIMVALE